MSCGGLLIAPPQGPIHSIQWHNKLVHWAKARLQLVHLDTITLSLLMLDSNTKQHITITYFERSLSFSSLDTALDFICSFCELSINISYSSISYEKKNAINNVWKKNLINKSIFYSFITWLQTPIITMKIIARHARQE